MTSEPYQPAAGSPIHGDDPEITYSVEVVAEMAGVSTQTVLHYQELGIVTPVKDSSEFDTENLRQLSRLEHLRHQHDLTDSAVQLIAGLFTEIEQLREERRWLYR
jgi:DNA-binding transcriptional MerR regulator